VSDYNNKIATEAVMSAAGGLIEALGMCADNQAAIQRGESPPFTGANFEQILNERGLHHNAIYSLPWYF